MRLFLSRFAKMVSLLTMSVAFLLFLTLNVFAETDLTTNNRGFYQIQNSAPLVYGKCGSSSTQVLPADYNMGGQCWYLTVGTMPDELLTRDYVQITLVVSVSAVNSIHSDYRDDFFPGIKYVDTTISSGTSSEIPYDAVKDLVPIKVSQSATSSRATLNIMLSRDQFVSICSQVGSYKRFFIMPQLNSNFMISQLQATSGIELVLFNTVRWSDTTDLIPIDEQTLQQLAQLQQTVDSGFTAVIDGQNHTNEKLDSIDSAINGNYVDPSDMAGIDSSIGDHSAAEAEVKDALSNIENISLIDAEGNPIDISLDGEYFKNLENYFNFQLDGPSVTNSADIFRKTLTGYIGLFGSFIFFPLVLGILGALLGRPSGA